MKKRSLLGIIFLLLTTSLTPVFALDVQITQVSASNVYPYVENISPSQTSATTDLGGSWVAFRAFIPVYQSWNAYICWKPVNMAASEPHYTSGVYDGNTLTFVLNSTCNSGSFYISSPSNGQNDYLTFN